MFIYFQSVQRHKLNDGIVEIEHIGETKYVCE